MYQLPLVDGTGHTKRHLCEPTLLGLLSFFANISSVLDSLLTEKPVVFFCFIEASCILYEPMWLCRDSGD